MKTETVMMPRTLTAENGAKALLSGEFFETVDVDCSECADIGEVKEDCLYCSGTGVEEIPVAVSWTTIKEIYKKAVEELGE